MEPTLSHHPVMVPQTTLGPTLYVLETVILVTSCQTQAHRQVQHALVVHGKSAVQPVH